MPNAQWYHHLYGLPFRLDIPQQVRVTPPPRLSHRAGRDHDRVTVETKIGAEPNHAADRCRERERRRKAKSIANGGTHAVTPGTIVAPNGKAGRRDARAQRSEHTQERVRVRRSDAPRQDSDAPRQDSEAVHVATLSADRKRHTNRILPNFNHRRVSC